jgi:penicillin-binding protein 1A
MAAALKGVPVASPGQAPAGLMREGDDWLYSEWQNGGAVAAISDGGGTQYAGPPTLIDAIKEWFK